MPQHLAGLRTLVTGARGFIGAHLCRHLDAAGAVVHATSRQAPAGQASGHAEWHVADLRDADGVQRLLERTRPDVVFHLAGLPYGARDLQALRPTFEHNLLVTVNVLEAVTRIGCRRLVVAGSLEEPTIGSPDPPSSPYAASKAAATSYARLCHALYATPVVIARLFMVYGPHQPDLQKLIPYVALSLLQETSPALSSGARQVDWIYVDDVVEACVALAMTPGLEGRSIDVGSGELVTVRTVVERLAALIPGAARPAFGVQPDRPLEQVRVAASGNTYALTGWRATTPLDVGLTRTIAWCRTLLERQP